MKILIVDDIAITRTTHLKLIKKINPSIEIETAGSYEEAIKNNLKDFNLIITDNILSNKKGSDLVQYTKDKNLNINIVLLTGWHFLDDELKKINIPVYHKPITYDIMKKIITDNIIN